MIARFRHFQVGIELMQGHASSYAKVFKSEPPLVGTALGHSFYK
jgi:hypothetical protein